jgi:hypothetical protein
LRSLLAWRGRCGRLTGRPQPTSLGDWSVAIHCRRAGAQRWQGPRTSTMPDRTFFPFTLT